MINFMFAIKALSPLHCGVGSGMGDIDLPVARHKVSGHPVIPGSTIKGVLKDEFKSIDNSDKEALEAIFGENEKGDIFASAISISDGLLVALPVRSFFGTFAYLASPYTLQQLKQVMGQISETDEAPPIPRGLGLIENSGSYRAKVTPNSLLTNSGDWVLLEDLDLRVEESTADDWAQYLAKIYFDSEEEQELFSQRFAIVDDNVLNFLCDTALPVDARIKIDKKTGTVARGALWYEETVPPETLFLSLVGMDRSYKENLKNSAEELIKVLLGDQAERTVFTQVGGKATTGKGFVSVRMLQGGHNA